MENITKWSTFHQATLKMRSSPRSLLCGIPHGGSVAWGPAALPFAATVSPRCPYRSNFKKAHHHWALNSIAETWVRKCNLSLLNKWMAVHYLNTNTGKYLEVQWDQIPNITMLRAVMVKTKNVAMSNAKHLSIQYLLCYPNMQRKQKMINSITSVWLLVGIYWA